MDRQQFSAMAGAVVQGNVRPEVFFQKTMRVWSRLAAYLLRRWAAPYWYTLQDVTQDVLLGAWRAIGRFDPTRSESAAKYLEFNAIDYAKKRLHKVRGANLSGNADSEPGRFEPTVEHLAFRHVSVDLHTDPYDKFAWDEPTQENTLLAEASLRTAVARCKTKRERVVVEALALAEGDFQEGTLLLVADPAAREVFGLDRPRSATRSAVRDRRRALYSSVRRVVRRFLERRPAA